ncbi:MAG: hypothetical protein D6707_05930, partial [Bacteroidetes bacterium]
MDLKKVFYIILLSALFGACSNTKYLKENEYLLTKVNIQSASGEINTEELEPFLKQKPNRKIFFFFRFHLWVYNLPDVVKIEEKRLLRKKKYEEKNQKRKFKGKKEKHYRRSFGEWLKEVVGEPPVIYNKLLTQKTAEQMEMYLHQNGYFRATVKDTVIFKRKKAKVIYRVNAGEPYTIRKVRFSIIDTTIKNDVIQIGKESLIKPGERFRRALFEEERIRFSNEMKNLGYYDFSPSYIEFKADSSAGRRKIDITMVIKSLKDSLDQIIPHKKWRIESVTVCPKGVFSEAQVIAADSINDVTCLNLAEIGIRKEVLDKNIFIRPGDYYSLKKTEYTRKRLGSLNIFRYINIRYEKTGDSQLQAVIELVASPKHALGIEVNGTNRAGNLGINGSVNYQNKNTFSGAEVLKINVLGGLEAQKLTVGTSTSDNTKSEIVKQLPFNTIEYGPNISLDIPELFLPAINKDKLPKYYAPETSFNASYNFQQRPDYTRNIALFSYAYSWKSEKNVQFYFQPAEINSVKINKTPDFEKRLKATNNSYLINSYTDHLISAGKFTVSYSNVTDNPFKNFFYVRTLIESGGNLLYFFAPNLGLAQNENRSYTLFGIPFSQYLKFDVEYSYHSILTKSTSMVYRVFAGVGEPLKNLTSLPFEKSYFGGGANGIRAWTIRTLGPGALPDTATGKIDQIGDIQIEANAEYRFDIYSSFKGALFIDAGNIWLHKKNSIVPETAFDFTSFYRQFAIGGGFGLRYDMEFLIFRLDLGIPLRDPSLPNGERWIFQPKNQTNTNRMAAFGASYQKYKIKPLLNIA